MIRYKGRRVSRSIGIAFSNRPGMFRIFDYTQWKSQGPFPHEESMRWILSKNFITASTIFIGEKFGKDGTLKYPLADAGKLHQALAFMTKNNASKMIGLSPSIHASRPTDFHEYWIEKNENEYGKVIYSVYYNQTDKNPFEVLSANEFHFDYVISHPLTTVNV